MMYDSLPSFFAMYIAEMMMVVDLCPLRWCPVA